MRYITEQGMDLIKRFEGFRAQEYLCPGGYWTIGYGHVIVKETYLDGISEQAASNLLLFDVGMAERSVLRLIRVQLSDGQFDALVSFTFNLGGGALQRSRLRAAVNREDHADVPAEFMRWTFAGGRQLQGLISRRRAEAALYASG